MDETAAASTYGVHEGLMREKTISAGAAMLWAMLCNSLSMAMSRLTAGKIKLLSMKTSSSESPRCCTNDVWTESKRDNVDEPAWHNAGVACSMEPQMRFLY